MCADLTIANHSGGTLFPGLSDMLALRPAAPYQGQPLARTSRTMRCGAAERPAAGSCRQALLCAHSRRHDERRGTDTDYPCAGRSKMDVAVDNDAFGPFRRRRAGVSVSGLAGVSAELINSCGLVEGRTALPFLWRNQRSAPQADVGALIAVDPRKAAAVKAPARKAKVQRSHLVSPSRPATKCVRV